MSVKRSRFLETLDDLLASAVQNAVLLGTRLGVERYPDFNEFALPERVSIGMQDAHGDAYILPTYSFAGAAGVAPSRMTMQFVAENQAGAGSVLRAMMQARLYSFQDEVNDDNWQVFDASVARKQKLELSDWMAEVYPTMAPPNADTAPSLEKFLTSDVGIILLRRLPPVPIGDVPDRIRQVPGSRILPETLAALNEYLRDATEVVDDLWDLTEYSVRETFETYGVKIWLKADSVLGILCYINNQVKFLKPHHAEYARAVAIAKASISLHMVVRLHAVRTHVCSAERMSLTIRQSEAQLKQSLPVLFHLMKLLTFNTIHKNQDVMILTDRKALFNRAYALTESALGRFIQSSVDLGRLTREELLGPEDSRWFDLANRYFMCCEALVNRVFEHELQATQNENRDRRADYVNWFETAIATRYDVAEFMFHVTCYHGIVGDSTMIAFALNGFLIPKVRLPPHDPLLVTDHDLLINQCIVRSVVTRIPQILSSRVTDVLNATNQALAGFWTAFVQDVTLMDAQLRGDAYLSRLREQFFNANDMEISVGY